MGFTVLPPEAIINEIGYYLLGEKNFDKSFGFLEMNVRNYPDSPNAFDSLGDWYAAAKQNDKAIENYEKSLKLQEMPDTRKKLEQLKKS